MAPHHGKGKSLPSASGSGAARDGNEEEESERDDAYGDDEEEIFDAEEINPHNYVHMGAPHSLRILVRGPRSIT
jgi:hypothetical protein